MKKIIVLFILTFILLLLLLFKQIYFSRFIEQGLPTYRYCAQSKHHLFLSVRKFRSFIPLFMQLRETTFPFIGSVNQFIYSLEYETGHTLTEEDWNQLLGKDVTVQLSPYFLFISKTKAKYSIFFFLHTKNDEKFSYRGFIIKKRKFKTIPLTLYYTFTENYLFVSDHLKGIKKILSGYYTKNRKLAKADFIIFDDVPDSPLSFLFSRQRIIYGRDLSNLKIRQKNNGVITSPMVFYSQLNISKLFHLHHKKITGFLFIHSFHSDASYQFSMLVPSGLQADTEKQIKKKIIEFFADRQTVFEYTVPGYKVFSNSPEKYQFIKSPVLFQLYPKKLLTIDVLKEIAPLSDLPIIKVIQE